MIEICTVRLLRTSLGRAVTFQVLVIWFPSKVSVCAPHEQAVGWHDPQGSTLY